MLDRARGTRTLARFKFLSQRLGSYLRDAQDQHLQWSGNGQVGYRRESIHIPVALGDARSTT